METQPNDIKALDRWDAYTTAKVAMFRATDIDSAPWTVVKSNDKKRARTEAMRSVLVRFDYDDTSLRPTPIALKPTDALLGPGHHPTIQR